MTEFTIGPHTYRTIALAPRLQLHVVRRMAPVITSLLGAVQGLTLSFGADGEIALPKDGAGETVNPFASLSTAADVLAQMADKDVDYVMDTLLGAAQRQSGTSWAPVMVNGVCMFSADLDLAAMLRISWEVGKANLSGFTATFQSLGLGKVSA